MYEEIVDVSTKKKLFSIAVVQTRFLYGWASITHFLPIFQFH
jgi:hypothetical protein